MSRISSSALRMLVVSVVVALALPAFGGSVLTGVMTGTITDTDGNPIADATVIIQSQDGTVTRTVLTNENGRFQSALLPPGDYNVVVQREGYTSVAQEATVLIDRTVTVLFSLQEGDLTETVTVTSEAPIVEKDTQEASVQVDKNFAEELPVGRSYQSYAFFSPGVTGGSNPNINGGSSGDNRYLIDGVDTTDPTTNTFGLNLNYDSIEAVDVKTSGISAEYGNFQGGILNVITKSGGNDFEGYIRFAVTNDAWQSDYDLDHPGAESANQGLDFDNNLSWSFNFGGPIVRDRAWFFVDYDEVNTLRQEGLLPSAGQGTFGRFFNGQFTSFKFTSQVTTNNKLTLQTTGDPADVSAGYVNPGDEFSYTLQSQGGNFYTAKWNSILSDTLYLDVNAANNLSEISVRQLPPSRGCEDLNGGYNLCDAGLNLGNGDSPALNLDVFRLVDAAYFDGFVDRPRQQANVAFTKFWLDTGSGDHTLKVGADYQVTESKNGFSNPGDNLYLYNTGPGGDPIFDRDYLIWYTVSPALPDENRVSISEGTDYALFVNDSWTLNENFSFNLGVRGELKENEQERGTTVTDQTLVSPRLGMTWDLTGEAKHVLKASAGRYIQALDLATIDSFNIGGDARNAWDTYFNIGPAGGAPVWLQIGSGSVGSLTRFFNPDMEPGYVDEYTLGFEEALTPTMSIGVRGIVRQWDEIINDVLVPVGDGVSAPSTETFFDNDAAAEKEYTAAQVTFNKRYSDNWQMLGVYTWSEAETNFPDSAGSDNSFRDYTQTASARRIFEDNRFGLAPWDRTNIARINAFYNVPLKSTKSQFTIGGEFTYQSGFAHNRQDSSATYSVPIPGVAQPPGDPCNTVDDDLDGTVDNNGANLNQCATGTGTALVDPRGTHRWPSTKNLDLSLNYKLNLWKTQFGIRVEVFNVLDAQDQIDGVEEDGSNFKEPSSVSDYQDPRDYRLSFTLSW